MLIVFGFDLRQNFLRVRLALIGDRLPPEKANEIAVGRTWRGCSAVALGVGER